MVGLGQIMYLKEYYLLLCWCDMEYMLMPDGTVVVYTLRLDSAWDVFAELQERGGSAYYWQTSDTVERWYRIDTYTHAAESDGILAFSVTKPPEVILLAVMLE